MLICLARNLLGVQLYQLGPITDSSCYRSQAVRTIMFDSRAYLGRNAAVMIAWILLSCGTVAVFSWYMRRYDHSLLICTTCSSKHSSAPSSKHPSDREVDKILIQEEKR